MMTHYDGNPERGSGLDGELFQRFRRGENGAMKQLFDTYYPKLVFYAEKYLRNDAEAEDIGSIALQRAWDSRTTYNSPRHLINGLYYIARNECVSVLRRRGRDGEKIAALMQLQSDAFDVNRAVDPERVRAETLGRVWQEIYRLLDQQNADMLKLHFKVHLTDQEIADMYRISVKNVQQRRSRMLDKLHKALGKRRFVLILLLLISELP